MKLSEAKLNTDRELWRELEGDYYSDSIFVTEAGGIGINCGGNVIVKPLKDWHTAMNNHHKSAMEIRAAVLNEVDHPPHYGGADNPYEAIKVIEAWGLGFNLGNTVKYIAREGHKGSSLKDLKKARWYLDREIANREKCES
jgi:hypothetical protein